MKKRSAAKKVVIKRSLVHKLMDKKHRPVHGFALGALMILFQSIWGILALAGGILMVLSALAFITGKMKK